MKIRRLSLVLSSLVLLVLVISPIQAQDYVGVVITVATQAAPEISGPIDQYRSEWEAETGAIVSIQTYPFGDLYQNIVRAARDDTGEYDLIVYASDWSGDIMGGGHVVPIPDDIRERVDWEDILPLYRERIAAWGGTVYALPFDGDSHMMYFRNDLVDPEGAYAADFEAQFGYPLDEPETWSQYFDMASFFHGQTVNTGGFEREIAGVSEAQRPDAQSYWFLISRAAGYAKVPGDACFFFSCSDDSPMMPRVNNPGWVRALQDWIDIRPYGVEDMGEHDVVDVRRIFPAGEAVFALDWGDIGPVSNNEEISVVRDNVGFSMLPGGDQYWDYNADGGAGAWVTPDEGVNRAPFIAFGGWIFSVMADSANIDAALDFAAFMADRDLANVLATTGGTGVNPLRASQFENLDLWLNAGFSEESALDYLEAIEQTIAHPNAVLDIRIPGSAEYLRALDQGIARALAGTLTAQEALDQVAEDWDFITDRYGRTEQLNFYLESLGL